MAFELEISKNQRLLGIFSKQFGRKRVNSIATNALKDIAEEFKTVMINKRMSLRAPGDGLIRRSGKFAKRKTFKTTIDSTSDKFNKLNITIRGKQAAIQEFGGTINAKGDGYLAIPLEASRTSKYGPVKRGYESPRNFPFSDTSFLIPLNGGFLVVVRSHKNGPLTAYYKLQKSVTLSPKLGARDVIKGKKEPEFRRFVINRLAKARAEYKQAFEKGI